MGRIIFYQINLSFKIFFDKADLIIYFISSPFFIADYPFVLHIIITDCNCNHFTDIRVNREVNGTVKNICVLFMPVSADHTLNVSVIDFISMTMVNVTNRSVNCNPNCHSYLIISLNCSSVIISIPSC